MFTHKISLTKENILEISEINIYSDSVELHFIKKQKKKILIHILLF